MKSLAINLGHHQYPIDIGAGMLGKIGDYIPKDASKVFVITDEGVMRHHQFPLAVDEVFIVPEGEQSKSFKQYESLCDQILAKNIDRKTVLIAFGGGVVGDLTGFIASSLLRGIRYIQVPTTLLSQVDSSVGGKTAINVSAGKNLVGAFYHPIAVVIDTDTLKTLPEDQWKSGYAEVLKYGLIKDKPFFDWLDIEGNPVNDPAHMVQISCQTKADIVEQDEKESGQRALLNFGHTFGHAIETHNQYQPNIPHGIAVCMGMVIAAKVSVALGHLSQAACDKIIAHLEKMAMPVKLSQLPYFIIEPQQMIELMTLDKKVKNGHPTFILLKDIGQAFITQDVPEDVLLSVISLA